MTRGRCPRTPTKTFFEKKVLDSKKLLTAKNFVFGKKDLEIACGKRSFPPFKVFENS